MVEDKKLWYNDSQMVEIIKTLQEAETMRAQAAGEVTQDIEKTQACYLQAIEMVKRITADSIPESLAITDPQTKIGVGQAEWTIATIYTSLAKHGARNDDETREFLRLAAEHLNSPLLQIALPEMEKTNKSATGDPLLWRAEIARIWARIQERQPNATPENIAQAIKHYSKAVDYSYNTYLEAAKTSDRSLQLAALSAYTTALGERAKIRPIENKEIALSEMSTVAGILYSIYQEYTNFDRLETVLGRIIDYCLENNVSEDHPAFRQSVMLYLELARISKDEASQTRFKLRLEVLQKKNLPVAQSLIEALKTTMQIV